ncbi:MAG: hypothetical protein ACUVQ0_01420 [Thermoproteota archaeon]
MAIFLKTFSGIGVLKTTFAEDPSFSTLVFTVIQDEAESNYSILIPRSSRSP